MCAPVPQTMFGSLTSCYGNSGVGLMANAEPTAGAPVAHVSQTLNLNHAESSFQQNNNIRPDAISKR
ncbi:unnamed protein product [Urochloa humidicola]